MKIERLAALIEEFVEQDALTYNDIAKIVNQIIQDEGLDK